MLLRTTICATCKTQIAISLDAGGKRIPCPRCGATERSHDATGELQASPARVGLKVKAKQRGAKKPHVELTTGPSTSTKLGKPVQHDRLIDRANNRYSEKVQDYESGEVLHQCDEPLTKHVGHGSARRKT